MPATNKDLSSLSTEEKRELLAKLLEKKLKKEKSIYPLSYAQKAMWFLYQMAPEDPTYNAGFAARICSAIDLSLFRESVQELINRHPSLRTTFIEDSGKPVQEVHGYQELQLEEIDASAWNENEVYEKVVEAYKKPFDLRQGSAFRVSLFTKSPTEHVFLMVAHHIIFDATSLWILLNEFRILYSQRNISAQPVLVPLARQYADFVQWESDMVNSPIGERHWDYWQQQLSGELPVLSLPTDRPRPPIQTHNGASHPFIIDKRLTQQIRSFAQAEGATLYMTLLAAFQTLLYRYTGQEDILVGSSVTARSQAEFTDIVGYLVNVVVLRANISGDPSFRKFLQQTRQSVLDMLEHQDYPFPLLVERLKPERDPSRSPLYQVLFDLQRVHQSEELATLLTPGDENVQVEFGDLTLKVFQIPQQEGLADLGLQVLETDEVLCCVLKYNTNLFDASTITRMNEHFLTLLAGIVTNPEEEISRLPILTALEQQQLLIEWNNTAADYPVDLCIHQLIESQANLSPDAVAVVFEDKQLTYRELNAKANQLAHYLISLNVRSETLVGICVDRSPEMIVGILGILKAGGAYVPLDPTYPKERLAFMLEDAQVRVLLTQQSLLTIIPSHDAEVVCLDTDWERISSKSKENPRESTTKNNLAYVIYTSGSTGKPKGAMLTHQGLTNVSEAQVRAFRLGPSDHVLQFSSLNFDASTFEIFMALRVGATLHVGTKASLLPGLPLAQFLKENAITIVTLPPSVLALLPNEEFPTLRTINVAGEACSPELVGRWAVNHRFFNLYGPTETTIWATIAECTHSEQKPPIGRPIPNLTTYILDKHLQPVPIGVPGELHIGGVGLARGYLNRPDLTAEKFISNPFSKEPRALMYKTGDLARYLQNGDIEFLGRIDHQVKIRGFRVELGEIEAILEQSPAVHEAKTIVQGKEALGQQIVAYLRLQPGQDYIKSELLSHLKEKLPDYMVPSAFVTLETFPLTPNGKLDLKALPKPEVFRPDLEESYIAPQTEVEQTIAAVWQDVLQLDKVGIHDNFFDLGGHSLLVAQVHSKLRNTLQINDLPLVKLFQYTTISSLAKHLEDQAESVPSRQVLDDRAERQKAALARQKQLMRKVKQAGE